LNNQIKEDNIGRACSTYMGGDEEEEEKGI
jgi:hypothetical protein